MKKAKIMLASIAVLAVVGGALAFKAQNFTGKQYCTIDPSQPILAKCTSFVTNVRFADGDQFRYSETSNTADCNLVTCPDLGEIAPE